MTDSASDPTHDDRMGPFGWIVPARRGLALVVLLVLTFSLSLWLAALGDPLATDAAPSGIVSFELARTAEGARAVLDSWDAEAREAAMLVQGVDFLYLLAYPAFFSLTAIQIGRRLGGRWLTAAVPLAWAMWLAAPLDAVENWALIEQLRTGPDDGAALLAWACAIPKFALVAVLVGFVLAGLSRLVVRGVRA
ncbi:MAG: hypothetical protein OEV20_07415 [Actinomycetota bacterium]|nr:hypothetical protein [Actinomycetota bacterium]